MGEEAWVGENLSRRMLRPPRSSPPSARGPDEAESIESKRTRCGGGQACFCWPAVEISDWVGSQQAPKRLFLSSRLCFRLLCYCSTSISELIFPALAFPAARLSCSALSALPAQPSLLTVWQRLKRSSTYAKSSRKTQSNALYLPFSRRPRRSA